MDFFEKLFSEDNDIVEITMVQEYHHLEKLSCLYPDVKTRGKRSVSIVHFLIYILTLVYHLCALSITAGYVMNSLSLLFQTVHLLLLILLTFSLLCSLNLCRPIVARIHKDYYGGLHGYDEFTENYRPHLKLKEKKKKKFLYGLIVALVLSVGVVVILVAPVLHSALETTLGNNTNGVSYNLPFPEWTPFGTDTWTFYIISFSLQTYSANMMLLTIYCGVFMLFTFTQFLHSEIELLIHSLEHLQERTLLLIGNRNKTVDFSIMKMDKELNSAYKYCLKENVLHHLKIIEICNDANIALSVPVFVSYFFGTITIAFAGVVIYGDDPLALKLTALALSGAETFNVFYLAWCGEQIITSSEKLSFILYKTDWNYLDKSGYLMIQIMMARAQRPLSLEGGYFFPMSFETFSY
uniref:Odorant receptor n=3 Tax=Rhodnius prolixus TaxID=13249 RepID=T1H8V0_RHOPR